MSDTVAHCETGGPRMKSRAGSTSHPFRNSATNDVSSELEPGAGTFREEFTPLPGEVVAQEHWCSSGFAETDLDLQLKKHGIHKLIVIGQKANTCIEATVRYAAELGYDVTLVKDAIASYNWEEMRTTLEINLPNYATAILSAADTIAALEHTTL